jgi:hypothetical protein
MLRGGDPLESSSASLEQVTDIRFSFQARLLGMERAWKRNSGSGSGEPGPEVLGNIQQKIVVLTEDAAAAIPL